MTIHAVNDFLSNVEENIQVAARALSGNSVTRRKVFAAVYTGKSRVKTVPRIMKSQGLTHQSVLMAGRSLATLGLVRSVKDKGRIAFEKVDHIHQFKARILRLASSTQQRESMATKRNHSRSRRKAARSITVKFALKQLQVRQITVDEIGSFSKVRGVKVDEYIPKDISEVHFRTAIKHVLGEHGEFKDWGGEPNDLFTSRLTLNRGRMATAFAFKGPAISGKLTPGMMGKNGDQIQRLFGAPAEVFVIQYGGQVGQSAYQEMEAHAYARAATHPGERIHYCIVDGTDSHRLLKAYPKAFKDATPKKAKKK